MVGICATVGQQKRSARTCWPGWKTVPRWRTRMFPGMTYSSATQQQQDSVSHRVANNENNGNSSRDTRALRAQGRTRRGGNSNGHGLRTGKLLYTQPLSGGATVVRDGSSCSLRGRADRAKTCASGRRRRSKASAVQDRVEILATLRTSCPKRIPQNVRTPP